MNEKPNDRKKLENALEHADLRVLLMVLYHVTGDEKWLSEPYCPTRDVTVIADINAGFDPEQQAGIRHAAADILSRDAKPAITDPGNELMLRMMRHCLNEQVPPEYAEMMREEVGFASRLAEWHDPGRARQKLGSRKFRVGIVGAGTAGIALATNLKKIGVDFVVFERAQEVGGTWREHTYPGCSVDTPNHAYSFSFGSRYSWSRYFASRDEIQDYICGIADETGIRQNIRFSTTVTSAAWNEDRGIWEVGIDGPDGHETAEVDALVSAIGQLSKPYRMPIKGEETFTGQLFHPMRWPTNLDLSGKRVVVVGTGASAMQIVTTIAPEVGHLSVYQRTPQWVRPIPRYHDPIDEDQQWLLKTVPFYAEWFRLTMLWRYGDGLLPTLRKDPDWPHPTRSVNSTNERHRVQMVDYIKERLAGREDLLDKVIPGYPPYGKRILLDAGWYDTLRRTNVELVTCGIDHIEGDTLVRSDGTSEQADVVILSTGYDVNTMTSGLNITGRNGQSLADTWGKDDPFAHLSISVPGFPNLFIISGPNTALAHGGSGIFMNECISRYIADFITHMVEDDIQSVEVTQKAADEYTARVNAEHEGLVWTSPGLDSYYRNSRGRVTSANPWRMVDFWSMTHQADPENYHVTYRHQAAAEAAQKDGSWG
ncbi:4-hydroxyacetophenone monooxygenase [Lutimaribacter pacificus]|uniref:4-hydroxyacetophenone monooxygenase n=1 Tax=Lutimaribacter pacificus TaxID=391948 RepID=A0A1H0HLP9_9RHOB|nr:NAD(P)/FAD-dependent oxidoreductase [Lutimaribacter pacificus]SDO20138.1 4-hydroxyacetophenone monooxygenase [Lutimaribacter pacificus]SHK34228.1 4-hydroxyacetophenone monooxygenase [Lutimaribacter pacificus]